MNMLIVESGAKARTIQKYLGKDWKVLACGGHIQTLPNEGKEGRKAYWANRKGQLPTPPWVWTDRGEKVMNQIYKEAEKNGIEHFYLATDPDREGEFIAWRLAELLEDHGDTIRVTFQEITKPAIEASLETPGEIDMALVKSALVRKFLDRLVGFRASKFARPFVAGRTASMGRVQTPALGFVVERELEREAHVPIPYWEVRAKAHELDFQVRFHETDDPDAWRDNEEKIHPNRTSDGDMAERAEQALDLAGAIELTDVKERSRKRKPKAAFSTDALLQDAGSRWSWSPNKTMGVAKDLYEGGHITYLRTDSTRIADVARDAARNVIVETWGDDHLGPGVEGKTKGKVQDAHEAIRPTDPSVAAPEGVSGDPLRLYELIRARLLASQMAPAVFATLSMEAQVQGFERPLRGATSWRVEAGWQAAFDAIDPPGALEPPAFELMVGTVLELDKPEDPEDVNPELYEGETKPPPRYRAHTLVKAMKESGIGRPSTYAKTVEKLQDRKYVETDSGALMPTSRGRDAWLVVAPFYRDDETKHDLFSVEFTGEMEEVLDTIEGGEADPAEVWVRYREAIRALHNTALEQRRQGTVTKALADRLGRMLENAPKQAAKLETPIAEMTQKDAQALLRDLKEQGIEAAPTDRQRKEIRRLVDLIDELDEAGAAALVEAESVDAIETSKQASTLIDTLRKRVPNTRKPSVKQIGAIRALAKKHKLSEEEACALVDEEAKAFSDLTGGRDGTASALITLLRKRPKPEGDADEKGASADKKASGKKKSKKASGKKKSKKASEEKKKAD